MTKLLDDRDNASTNLTESIGSLKDLFTKFTVKEENGETISVEKQINEKFKPIHSIVATIGNMPYLWKKFDPDNENEINLIEAIIQNKNNHDF
jgi:hypothetical protein